jgi:HK97 family phage major capsid protein
MDRAYSMLTVKSVGEDSDCYVIKGIASTPRVDRMGDIVEPLGAKFELPIPLFMDHKSEKRIGHVTFAQPTKTHIGFEARLPKVKEAGVLRDRIEEAVQSIRYRLLAATSIGFQEVEGAVERMKNGGRRYKEWFWRELSLVSIPANPDAIITGIKSLDTEIRAALGRSVPGAQRSSSIPGASGQSGIPQRQEKHMHMQSYEERLSGLQDQRGEKANRIKELAEGCGGDFDTLEDGELNEYRNLREELKSLDTKIEDVRGVMQAISGAKAVPSDAGTNPDVAHRVRRGDNTAPKAALPKGIRFARYAKAVAFGKGSRADTLDYAKQWRDQTPEVEMLIKATVGSTASGNWAELLAAPQEIMNEFMELVMPRTILGRVQGFRRVPFNRRIKIETGGALIQWVGQGAPKPVGEMTWDDITVPRTKVAGIVVLTDELVLDSSIDAEAAVRDSLQRQTVAFLDDQAFDPAVTVSAGVRPASLTNGVTPVVAAGTTAAQIRTAANAALDALGDLDESNAVWIARPSVAREIGSIMNGLGQPEFPGLGGRGGEFMGLPVITSSSIAIDTNGAPLILMVPNEVFLAQDPQIRLDASREATISLTGDTTAAHSLWQNNEVGIRAEQFVHWLKGRANAVQVITGL